MLQIKNNPRKIVGGGVRILAMYTIFYREGATM